MTATLVPVALRSDRDRRAERKARRSRIGELLPMVETCKQLGLEIAKTELRIKELRVLAGEANILKGESDVFDEERRKLEDRLSHLRNKWKSLSSASSEIAKLEGELRGVLADPALLDERAILMDEQLWATKRLSSARAELAAAEGALRTQKTENERTKIDYLNVEPPKGADDHITYLGNDVRRARVIIEGAEKSLADIETRLKDLKARIVAE